jgi:hypothetical protein
MSNDESCDSLDIGSLTFERDGVFVTVTESNKKGTIFQKISKDRAIDYKKYVEKYIFSSSQAMDMIRHANAGNRITINFRHDADESYASTCWMAHIPDVVGKISEFNKSNRDMEKVNTLHLFDAIGPIGRAQLMRKWEEHVAGPGTNCSLTHSQTHIALCQKKIHAMMTTFVWIRLCCV